MTNTQLMSGAVNELIAINQVIDKKSVRLLTDNNLTGEYFTTYKPIYDYIINFNTKYNTVPSREALSAEFADSFQSIAVTDPDEAIVAKLREAKTYRDILTDFPDVVSYIKNGESDKALELMGKISSTFQKGPEIPPIDLVHDAKSRYDKFVERGSNPDKSFVSTGLKELDSIIGGWNREEESAVICARPGVGKSWWLTYFALAAAKKGLTVGYYSGEMEANAVGYRLDTFLGNLPNGSLTRGNFEIKAKYEKYLESTLAQLPGKIICITPEMFGGSVTVPTLSNFIDKYNIEMLCIDQISLLESTCSSKNLREQFASVSKELRILERVKKIPMIIASQLNRVDTTESGVSTRNLAESDRVGQDATTVICIERKGDDTSLEIIKAREARTGDKLVYNWNVNMGILKYVPTGKDSDIDDEDNFNDAKDGDVF